MDVFNNDAFSLTSLTATINELPHAPMRIASMNLYDERGITTTTVWVEKKGNTLAFVATKERGQNGQVITIPKRNVIPLPAVHLPQTGSILADEVQNVRAFGSESQLEGVQDRVNEHLGIMKGNIDATHEWHRIGAIKGQVLDANGTTVLVDIYNTFEITQITVNMALGTASTNVKGKITEAKRHSEDALGGLLFSGWHAFCGNAFFDELVGHPKVEKAHDRPREGMFLREDNRRGFPFGDVIWENYRGKVSDQFFVPEDEAYLFPLGVPGMFISRYAPADYNETVNTIGLPYYARQEAMPMGKGIALEAQSNPLHLCTRPGAVIRLTRA